MKTLLRLTSWVIAGIALAVLSVPEEVISSTCDAVPDHFQFTPYTGGSYSLIIDSAAMNCQLELCDEIGVFDGGLCVGASVYQGVWPLPLVAWTDDSQTPGKDGYSCGNAMTFRLWRSGTSQEDSLTSVLVQGNGTFCDGPSAQMWLSCAAGGGGCDAVPDHFQFIPNTGESYSLIIDSAALNCQLEPCDEIGVFDGALCVGATVYEGTWPLPLVAWTNDSQTPGKDGYNCGNAMSFHVWRSTPGTEDSLTAALVQGNGTFCNGPFAQLWLMCCHCPHRGDPDGSGFIDAVDIQWTIDVVFFSLLAIHDPGCPSMRSDVDCSGFPDAVDIQWLIDCVFFNGIPPCDACMGIL